MLKGEKTKILGTIGDFEIGAKWQWKFHLHTVTVCLLAISVIILGCSSFNIWMQFNELSKARTEIAETKLEIIKIQAAIHSDLEEVRKMKAEMGIPESSYYESAALVKRSAAEPRSSNRENKENKPSNQATKNPVPSSKSTSSKNKPSPVSGVHFERDLSYFNTGSDGIFIRWQPQQWTPLFNETVELDHENSSLVIQTSGLYFIYAQVCYASTKENNSFEIRLMNKGNSKQEHSKIIAQCSSGTSMNGNDITCFTSLAQVAHAGDKIFLQQMQKDRPVMMSNGRSFWGVIKLAN